MAAEFREIRFPNDDAARNPGFGGGGRRGRRDQCGGRRRHAPDLPSAALLRHLKPGGQCDQHPGPGRGNERERVWISRAAAGASPLAHPIPAGEPARRLAGQRAPDPHDRACLRQARPISRALRDDPLSGPGGVPTLCRKSLRGHAGGAVRARAGFLPGLSVCRFPIRRLLRRGNRNPHAGVTRVSRI